MALKVFSAGVAGKLSKMTMEKYKEAHPDAACELQMGGSTAGVNKVLGGEKFDVLILADNTNIDQLMMPEYADGYYIWGGNEMIIMGNDISDDNWKEKLLDPNAVIKHKNPYDDPGGYRSVMAMKLADKVEPGLSEKLFNHPGYNGLDKSQYVRKGPPLAPPKAGERKGPPAPPPMKDGVYEFMYKSGAVSMGRNFATLPSVMSLGNPANEEDYKSVSFVVDGGAEIFGTTIYHAIVVPTNAENKAEAEEFVKMFLSNRFMEYGFNHIQKKVGNWNIELPNMWDAESKSYSIMTLMEVNGTNKQLDCIPLEPDMVVLDCGCGPGRVAIQAAKRVKKVICLDSSKGMLEECKKNCEAAGVTNVEFVLADWQETEIGKTIPEVDVVIQSRGGGGHSSLAMLQKAARKFAVNIMWAKGAPNLPTSRGKLFVDCYDEEAIAKHPELKMRPRPPMPKPGEKDGKGSMMPPMGRPGPSLHEELEAAGIELHVTTIEEGWDKVFATKQEAYDFLIELSRYPELVNLDKFHENVDKYLAPCEDGYYFFLPTQTDISWFKTRD